MGCYVYALKRRPVVAPSFLEWWEMMVLALPTYIYEPNVSELCTCVALE